MSIHKNIEYAMRTLSDSYAKTACAVLPHCIGDAKATFKDAETFARIADAYLMDSLEAVVEAQNDLSWCAAKDYAEALERISTQA